MSKLKAIDPTDALPSRPKILIYGAAGVGKSYTAMDWPLSIVVDSEGGASRSQYTDKLKKSGGGYIGISQGSQDFDVVIDQIKALATEEHKYKTLIIDSMTKLYELARADAAEKKGEDYGRDKKEANKPARRALHWINRLDMNSIIICHEIPLWGLDSSGQRTQVGTTYDGPPKLDFDLDLALQIIKTGPKRLAKVTKSRIEGFVDQSTFEWSYEKFAELYGRDIIERETKKLDLATSDQVSEFNKLVDVVRLDETVRADKLVLDNKEDFSELESSNAQKIINYLKSKVSK